MFLLAAWFPVALLSFTNREKLRVLGTLGITSHVGVRLPAAIEANEGKYLSPVVFGKNDLKIAPEVCVALGAEDVV